MSSSRYEGALTFSYVHRSNGGLRSRSRAVKWGNQTSRAFQGAASTWPTSIGALRRASARARRECRMIWHCSQPMARRMGRVFFPSRRCGKYHREHWTDQRLRYRMRGGCMCSPSKRAVTALLERVCASIGLVTRAQPCGPRAFTRKNPPQLDGDPYAIPTKPDWRVRNLRARAWTWN